MLSQNNAHTQRFQELLGEIQEEVDDLKQQVQTLQQENNDLKTELKETKDKEADVFSSLKETERMALKHQVKGLISKIDDHLEEQP